MLEIFLAWSERRHLDEARTQRNPRFGNPRLGVDNLPYAPVIVPNHWRMFIDYGAVKTTLTEPSTAAFSM